MKFNVNYEIKLVRHSEVEAKDKDEAREKVTFDILKENKDADIVAINIAEQFEDWILTNNKGEEIDKYTNNKFNAIKHFAEKHNLSEDEVELNITPF